MEATASRPLSGDRAQRIVDAMRHSIALRGTAGSTFDHVAREAGVSRGLLHYYFGTKEQLLVEVVRRDAEVRIDLLERQLAQAQTADDFVHVLLVALREVIAEEPDIVALGFELFTLSRRNADIATEYTSLLRRMRAHLAAVLAEKQGEGVLRPARRARRDRRGAVLAGRRAVDPHAGRQRARRTRRPSTPPCSRCARCSGPSSTRRRLLSRAAGPDPQETARGRRRGTAAPASRIRTAARVR